MIRNRKGSYSLEALFNLPVFLMLFLLIFETGFLMYDWSVVNYAASEAAVEAAKRGEFSETVYNETVAYLDRWTSGGDGATVTASVPLDTPVQRGEEIRVDVTYPVHFKTFVVDALAHWLVEDNDLQLRASAVASSEVYFEQ